MNGSKIYRITEGDYTPTGQWDEYPHLMDYRHAANAVAKRVREADDKMFQYLLGAGLTVWGGSLEIVKMSVGGRVTYAHELEPREGAYIAEALEKALTVRRAMSS